MLLSNFLSKNMIFYFFLVNILGTDPNMQAAALEEEVPVKKCITNRISCLKILMKIFDNFGKF